MHKLLKNLNIIWRLFGTGLSFIIFGLAGLFLGIIVFPLLRLMVRNPASRQILVRRIIGFSFRIFINMMRGLGVLSYRIEYQAGTDTGQSQLVIANHPTLIDAVFLVSLFPLADCVVKEAATRNPFMQGAVSAANYISNDDPGELLDSCISGLAEGGRLVLFPEGTRSVFGQPIQFKLGAAAVAVRAGVEILPVIINCSQPGLLAKNEPWYRVPPERPFFLIQVQSPVSVGQLVTDDLNPRHTTRALNKVLLDLFESRTA